MTTFAIINAVLSVLAIAGLTASALGWRHSLIGWDWTPEWYFAAAKILLAGGIAFRLLLWDVAWGITHHLTNIDAQLIADRYGQTNINIVSTSIILLGVYCSLKARQLVLLEDRGINWHWTIAWAYPRARTIVKIVTRRKGA